LKKKLSEGVIRGVISTNALELGVDIGGLDACVIDRYPGTIMSTKQQAGRAGRGTTESIVMLVAGSNALDQYYMQYPKEFFKSNSEEAVLNVSNLSIQAGHILCAAKEMPLTENDSKYFGNWYSKIVKLLEGEGLLEKDNYKPITSSSPHMEVSIKGCPCTDGCPSCIQSPKCGNHNEPLDKHAAIMILHELLGRSVYIPPESKSKKRTAHVKKTDKPVDTGAALNRVRRQLRRDVNHCLKEDYRNR